MMKKSITYNLKLEDSNPIYYLNITEEESDSYFATLEIQSPKSYKDKLKEIKEKIKKILHLMIQKLLMKYTK